MTHILVPRFILEQSERGQTHGRFAAVSLFVDISGFTTVTESLMQHGQHGAEVLAQVMLAIFDPLVRSVYQQGGFICSFAGDAFTAVVPGSDTHTRQKGLAAAWHIQQHMAAAPRHTTPYGDFDFMVKVGLADGMVEWGIVSGPNPNQLAYYFKGTAIDRCAQAEQVASGGDLVLSRAVYEAVQNNVQTAAVRDTADYLPITAVSDPLPPSHPLPQAPISLEQAAAFYPQELLTQTIRGEFRQALNLFISLPDDIQTHQQLADFMAVLFALKEQYGGLLNRIDFGDKGCHLLLFWGAPITYENDIERAINFISDLKARITFPIRAGMTYRIAHAGFIGSSLREEYTCYGRGVNLAARYMTHAPWNHIWLDEKVAQRSQAQFQTELLGHFRFKGFAQKQPVYKLNGRRQATPTPRYQQAMIGRQVELARLQQALDPIYHGRFAGVLTILGEAGMGKSRLVQELTSHNQTAVCFYCRTDEILRHSLNPFRTWLRNYFQQQDTPDTEASNKHQFTQKLNHLIDTIPDKELGAELDRTRSFLGALIDLHWPDSLYTQLEPKFRFENTLTAIKTLIKAESLRQPMILALEDAHWLDIDTAHFLPRLTRNMAAYPVVFLITSRQPLAPDLIDPSAPHQTIRLDSLKTADLTALAAAVLQQSPSPTLIQLLEQRTDGNPFFTEQILLYLQERGLLTAFDQPLPTDSGPLIIIPTDVRAILVARLDRLPPSVKKVVQTAAVLGREFDTHVLSHMLSSSPIRDAIKTAEKEAIWHTTGQTRYLFRHALMRDAAYDMQLRAHLHQLHTQAATTLETLYQQDLAPHYGKIAYHYDHANEPGQASFYFGQAGQYAQENYRNEEAIAYFSQALTLTPTSDVDTHTDLLLARETAYRWQGNREAQAQDLARLNHLCTPEQHSHNAAQVYLRQADYARLTSDYETALHFVQEAIHQAQEAKNNDVERKGYHIWGRILLQQGNYSQAHAQLKQALHHSQMAQNAHDEARSLYDMGLIYYYQGDYTAAQAHYQQAYTIYQKTGYRHGEINCLLMFGSLHNKLGSYSTAQTYYEKGLALCHDIGWRHGETFIWGSLGNNYFDLGDYQMAQHYHQQALATCQEVGDREGEAASLDTLSLIHHILGDNHTAQTYCQQALAIQQAIGRKRGEGYSLTYLGHILADLGQTAAATTAYRQAIALRLELGTHSQTMDDLAGLARVALQAGVLTQALGYVEEILAWVEVNGTDGIEFPIQVYLTCYQVLQASAEEDLTAVERANTILAQGHTLLQNRAAAIGDSQRRHQFLEGVPFNRALLTLWNQYTPTV